MAGHSTCHEPAGPPTGDITLPGDYLILMSLNVSQNPVTCRNVAPLTGSSLETAKEENAPDIVGRSETRQTPVPTSKPANEPFTELQNNPPSVAANTPSWSGGRIGAAHGTAWEPYADPSSAGS